MGRKRKARLYFESNKDRRKAYNILADNNFFLTYGENTSLKCDDDEVGYMLELLSFGEFPYEPRVELPENSKYYIY